MENIKNNDNGGKANGSSKKALLIVKKTLSSILLIICAILLVIAAWLCIDKFIIGSPVPSFCGYSSLSIATGSMSGTLEIGDIIIIKDTDDYKIGDIVTFLQGDDTVPTTHRIIQYAEDGRFITKGDANNADDGEKGVAKEEILGEMVCHMPILGMFVGWIKDGGGMIYLIAVILIIGLGSYMLSNEKKMAAMQAAQAPAEPEKTEKTEGEPKDEAPADNTEDKSGD